MRTREDVGRRSRDKSTSLIFCFSKQGKEYPPKQGEGSTKVQVGYEAGQGQGREL